MVEQRNFKIRRRYTWIWKWVILLAVLLTVRSLQTLTASVERADSPPVIRSGPCEIVEVIDATTFLIRQSVEDEDSSSSDASPTFKVRLMTIEIPTHRGDAELVASKSRQFTEQFLEGQKTSIQLDRRRVDRDGVGLVFLYADERCLNIELAKSGWALVKISPGDAKRYEKQLREAEKQARLEKIGIWAD